MIPMTTIYDLLCSLGATANYTGFFCLAYAVQLCTEQPERLRLVTKYVYPDVAKHCQTNWRSVERNIRTVGNVIWAQEHCLLEQMAGHTLVYRPSNAQLLAILSLYCSSRLPHAPDTYGRN